MGKKKRAIGPGEFLNGLYGPVGRIVARQTCAGLFLPCGPAETRLHGIYDVEYILGELSIEYKGQPAMSELHPERFPALDLHGLLGSSGIVTMEEWRRMGGSPPVDLSRK